MTSASRRVRRNAARRRARDGFYVEVPAGTNIDAWEARVRADPGLTDDERAVGVALAAMLREAP